jgi:antirestriction protein ArdC
MPQTAKEKAFIERTFDDIANKIAETLKIDESMDDTAKAQVFTKWVRSWASNAPQNGNSNRPYNGCNAFLTSLMMHHNGWKNPFFLTFNGVKKMGGRIVKGEKSLPIFWWEQVVVKDDEGEVKFSFPRLKVFKVWNVDQTTVDPKKCTIANCEGRKISEIENMVKDLEIEMVVGDPSYNPSTDKIAMPSIESFKTEADYYSTLFHEMGHWTMTEERCNRKGLTYAEEELVAEMTAVFLDAEFGIEGELQHPEYIGSWIKNLKDQPRAFFDACRKAQRAANFILKKKFDAEGKKVA